MSEHIRVPTRCGACGFFFEPQDRFYLFAQRGVASELPVSFSGYGDFSFPSSFYFDNNPDKTDVPWLCRRPNCCQCQESVESTAVHSDCLKLFVGLYRDFEDGLRQLWVAATWRSPWRGAPALNLNPVVDIRAIAKVSGLGRLTSLPLELCAMIEGFSSPVSLQSCSVLELAQRLLASVKQKQLSIPLTKISHWDRGESPEADNDNHFRFIRIAIDSQGLWRIERLSERPQEGTSYTRHVKYVVEAAECFSNVVVDFAFGLARLRLPSDKFYIWDTPCPPRALEHIVRPSPSLCHLGTIQTRGCTGITFFIGSNDLTYAVHAHTRVQPSAQCTAKSLAPGHEGDVAWVYVPIQGGLEEFGFSLLRHGVGYTSRPQCLLFSFKGTGTVFVGPFRMQPRKFLRIKRPLTLIYQNQEAPPITFVGAYSGEDKPESSAGPRHNPHPPSSLRHPHFSSASLKHICQVQILYLPDTDLCRGLIIQYKNGQRALGQCRVGLDTAKEWAQPSRICFINIKYDDVATGRCLQGVKVAVSHEVDHHHEEMGWSCCRMSGMLNFWFTTEEAKLEYLPFEGET